MRLFIATYAEIGNKKLLVSYSQRGLVVGASGLGALVPWCQGRGKAAVRLAWSRAKRNPRPEGRGCLTYAATGWGSGTGVASGCGAGRGLVTPAMKRSASLVALSRERQG